MSKQIVGRLPLKLALKCLVTAILLWVAVRSVDFGAVSKLLSGIDLWWAMASLTLTAIIVVYDATLLAGVIRLFSRRMSLGTALWYSLVGWFFSNVAPSTVGGDIFRGVQLSRAGLPIAAAIRIVLSIRVLSFITLVAVIAAGFPIALQILEERRDVMLLGGVLTAASGAIGALILLAHFPPRIFQRAERPLFRKLMTIANDFRTLLRPGSSTAAIWFAALAQHLLRVGVLACLAEGLGLGIPASTLFALTTAALLIAMVPISFGGWGVREIAFVYLLGAAGVSSEAALTLSIAFGLLRLLVGAIGGMAWLLTGDEHYRLDASSA